MFRFGLLCFLNLGIENEMDGIDMLEKAEKMKIHRESAGDTAMMPAKQVFWGVLMLVSLFVLVTAGLSAGRAAGNGSGNERASHRLGRVPDGAVAGDGAIAGGWGTEVLAAGKIDAVGSAGKPDGKTGNEGTAPVPPDGVESEGVNPALPDEGIENKGEDAPPDGKNGNEDADSPPEAEDTQPGGKTGSNEADAPGKETGNGDAEDADAPVVALTFDDGPFTKVTNRIVDVLLAHDAGATFFVVGSRIDMYSDTLKRVYESGFEVASHTWSHRDLNGLSADEVLKELNDTEERLNTYIPVGEVLLRPPYGNADEPVREIAGTALINWSLDSEDWKSRDADTIIRYVLSAVKDGDIILMHDLYESTAEAVEYLVPELVARGYRIVSVSELFELKGIPLEEGILYRNPFDCY